MKNTTSFRVTTSYIVAKILAVDKEPSGPVKSTTRKHIYPATIAEKVPSVLSKLLPRANFI